MEMAGVIMSKKKTLIIQLAILLIVFVGGVSLARFSYFMTGKNHRLIAGDVYMDYEEGNEEICLTNVFPESAQEARARNDNYVTFMVSGQNSTGNTIYYEILLNYGNDKESLYVRYHDGDLKFDLVEIDENDNELSYLVSDRSYFSIDRHRIYAGQIAANSSVTKRYKVRMWLSDSIIITMVNIN